MLGVPGGVEWLIVLFIAGLFAMVTAVVPVVLYWIIFRKAGLPEPLSLLALVPGFGPLIPPLILAIVEWPALKGEDGRELKMERDSTSTQQGNTERTER